MHCLYWMAAVTSFIIDEEYKYIHGANFGHLVIVAIKPEHLVQTLLLGLLLYVNGGCIVRTHFAITHSAGPGSTSLSVRKGYIFCRDLLVIEKLTEQRKDLRKVIQLHYHI